MKTHSDRSILDDLEALYALAVQTHGPQAFSSRIILDSLQVERRRVAGAAPLRPGPAVAARGPAAGAPRH